MGILFPRSEAMAQDLVWWLLCVPGPLTFGSSILSLAGRTALGSLSLHLLGSRKENGEVKRRRPAECASHS